MLGAREGRACGLVVQTTSLPIRSLYSLWDFGCGSKIRSDAKGVTRVIIGCQHAATKSVHKLRRKQKVNVRRKHQSFAHPKRGRCCYTGCPGRREFKAAKKKELYRTSMHCEECSTTAMKPVYYCNGNGS